jgi:cytochrome c-type biogenesis protein CcmE
MKKNNTRTVYLAAALLFLAGVGYLVASGLNQGSVYFVTVSEALAMPAEDLGQARLFGTVAPADIKRKPAAPGVVFSLRDKERTGQAIRVDYDGAVPDTFKPGVEVIVEGGLDASSGVFRATTLMTKCPSKYQKREQERSDT